MFYEEAAWFAEEVQNFAEELPSVSDYISPVPDSKRGSIKNRIADFMNVLPEHTHAVVIIGRIFHIQVLTPVREYVTYPGVTRWNEQQQQLEFHQDIYCAYLDVMVG